jgi:outer membrane protein TolC
VEAVAAQEALRHQHQVAEAAQAAAELAARMRAAGNFNRLAQAREQAFEADAALQLARAERRAGAARERLVRALGLWGEPVGAGPGGLRLPERLPDLPAAALEQPDLESSALAQRLDLQLAREDAERAQRLLGLTRSSRFVSAVEVGATRSSSNDGERSRGWEVGLALPIFDPGDARVARAEQALVAAQQRRAEVAINARSELREAHGQYRHAWDIAHHLQTEVLPLARQVSAENLLRYNGMLIGVFELLADARAQIGAVQAALEARRDFWLADVDLQMARLGRPTLAAGGAPASLPSTVAPTGGGH